jgi:hypothetical protein
MGVADSVYQVSVLLSADSDVAGVEQQIACHCCLSRGEEESDRSACSSGLINQHARMLSSCNSEC